MPCTHMGDSQGAIENSDIISSQQEGETQGVSMIYYGIGILPLIRMLKSEFPAAKQQWFVDDGSTAGKRRQCRKSFPSNLRRR